MIFEKLRCQLLLFFCQIAAKENAEPSNRDKCNSSEEVQNLGKQSDTYQQSNCLTERKQTETP